jgi:transposase
MTPSAPHTFAAVVGIDWADATHDVGLQAAGAATRACFQLEHTPEAIDAGGTPLRTRCTGHPVAVCLERNKGPLVFAWRTYDFLILFPLHPLTLARYRAALTPSRATDDPTDAARQRALLLPQRDKLRPLTPHRPTLRALAPLVEHRRRVGGDKVRLTQRLTSTLQNSFPQARQWFQDQDTRLFCDVLSRWPTRKAAPRARRSPLETFFRDHHVRSSAVLDTRLHAIPAASPLPLDEGVIAPQALLVQALVSQLRVTLQAIETFDHAIAPRAQRPPDFPLFQALPGAGPVFASRLLVAFGEPRDRSASAAALQRYAGMAPVTERSGKKSWGHWRLQCPKCLRHTFVEWAAASTRHACWAQVYSQQQRDQGKAHQAAVRALAFKWSRMLFRCWQDRPPDNEAASLQALSSRGASLLHHLAKAA